MGRIRKGPESGGRRTLTVEEKEHALKLVLNGQTVSQAAKATGLPWSTVKDAVKRWQRGETQEIKPRKVVNKPARRKPAFRPNILSEDDARQLEAALLTSSEKTHESYALCNLIAEQTFAGRHPLNDIIAAIRDQLRLHAIIHRIPHVTAEHYDDGDDGDDDKAAAADAERQAWSQQWSGPSSSAANALDDAIFVSQATYRCIMFGGMTLSRGKKPKTAAGVEGGGEGTIALLVAVCGRYGVLHWDIVYERAKTERVLAGFLQAAVKELKQRQSPQVTTEPQIVTNLSSLRAPGTSQTMSVAHLPSPCSDLDLCESVFKNIEPMVRNDSAAHNAVEEEDGRSSSDVGGGGDEGSSGGDGEGSGGGAAGSSSTARASPTLLEDHFEASLTSCTSASLTASLERIKQRTAAAGIAGGGREGPHALA